MAGILFCFFSNGAHLTLLFTMRTVVELYVSIRTDLDLASLRARGMHPNIVY